MFNFQQKKEKENNEGTIQTSATGCAAALLRLPVFLYGKCRTVFGFESVETQQQTPRGIDNMSGLEPTWPKIESAAVPRSSTSFFLIYIPRFVFHSLFLIRCLHLTPFSFPLFAAPAPLCYPISVILFLKEPKQLFILASFTKKGLKFRSIWWKKTQNINTFVLSQSVNLTHSLTRLVSTMHPDQICDPSAHCCAQPWRRDLNSHGKDNTAKRLGNLICGGARVRIE